MAEYRSRTNQRNQTSDNSASSNSSSNAASSAAETEVTTSPSEGLAQNSTPEMEDSVPETQNNGLSDNQENSNRALPGNDRFFPPAWPSFPNLSGGSGNQTLPFLPTIPSQGNYGQVRFLNASSNYSPVNIFIDGNNYAFNSRFGTISSYSMVSDGFHTITVRSNTGTRPLLYQQTFPFRSGEAVTMVLVDSGNGLDMVKVSDTSCNNLGNNVGCYRFANMSFPGSSYNLLLNNKETVFRGIQFPSASSYKQAMAGNYYFTVTNSASFSVVQELPVILIGATQPGTQNLPLLSFQVNIQAGKSYTTYLIGNTWSGSGLRALTVSD